MGPTHISSMNPHHVQDHERATIQPGRRLLQGPIGSLAHETGHDILQTSSLPRHDRKLNVAQISEIVLQDPRDPPGLRDHIWWIIPVSCLTQLMWIYLAYRIYKRCGRQTRMENRPPRGHELREITVRR